MTNPGHHHAFGKRGEVHLAAVGLDVLCHLMCKYAAWYMMDNPGHRCVFEKRERVHLADVRLIQSESCPQTWQWQAI